MYRLIFRIDKSGQFFIYKFLFKLEYFKIIVLLIIFSEYLIINKTIILKYSRNSCHCITKNLIIQIF